MAQTQLETLWAFVTRVLHVARYIRGHSWQRSALLADMLGGFNMAVTWLRVHNHQTTIHSFKPGTQAGSKHRACSPSPKPSCICGPRSTPAAGEHKMKAGQACRLQGWWGGEPRLTARGIPQRPKRRSWTERGKGKSTVKEEWLNFKTQFEKVSESSLSGVLKSTAFYLF